MREAEDSEDISPTGQKCDSVTPQMSKGQPGTSLGPEAGTAVLAIAESLRPTCPEKPRSSV